MVGKKIKVFICYLHQEVARDIIYGMLKNNQKYDPQVDQANREKSINKKTENGNGTKPDKNRRYQKRDQNAPISKRQQKKRKQLFQSQQIDNKENWKKDKQTNSQGRVKQKEKT